MNPNQSSCSCGGHACDCCTGVRPLTPETVFNPAGLGTLRRRAGTWDSFRQTMIARLSSEKDFPALAGLRTRESDDPAIAFLDAAAVVGDVLTFYNERLANESYLRTATERRSLTELGKLVGYRPRPGVAAGAWLAFSLEDGYAITVPAGTRVQSVPASPKETAQTFETSADLAARAELNAMKPRPSVPQEISPANVLNVETIWLKGIGLSLKPGDLLLFVFPDDEAASTPRKIHAVTEDAAAGRTSVKLVVEKLSAAYYLPVLRKAAQAVRTSIPGDWLTNNRKWAKDAAASLDRFSEGLTADTSLLAMEKLFQPNPEIADDEGLDAYLKAVMAEGEIAAELATGLTERMAWGKTLTVAWTEILNAAKVSSHAASTTFVANRKTELEGGKISEAAALLLDEVTGSLKNLIDNASTPGDMKTELQSLRSKLITAWNAAETLMRTSLNSGDSDDKSLIAIVKKSPPLVAALPAAGSPHDDLATAFTAMAVKYGEIHNGDDAQEGVKDDLTGVARTGGLADSLTAQRKRFRSESVSGLSRALALLTGRYRNLPQIDDASVKAAAEIAKLAELVTGNPGLEEMNTALATSLDAVTAAVKNSTDATLHRLEAEMRILSGQVSVSPSGVSSLATSGAEASSAALGNIVSGTVLQQPAAPGAPLSVPRSLGAFLPVASDTAESAASDAISRLAGRLAGSSDDDLFDAWRKLNTGSPAVEIHAMRVQTGVFGSAAPMRFGTDADKSFDARFNHPGGFGDWTADNGDLESIIRLDGEHGKVVRDGWVVIERPETIPLQQTVAAPMNLKAAPASDAQSFLPFDFSQIFIFDFATFSFNRPDEIIQLMVRRVSDVRTAPHSGYSLSGKTTTVSLLQENAWGTDANLGFGVIRRTKVHAASELLTLAEMPVSREVGRAATAVKKSAENPFAESRDVLVLDGLFQGIVAGHRLIVAGQRVDSVSERQVREYALVSKVEHVLTPAAADPLRPVPGDTPHTRLTLSKELQYVYRRDTVTVFGNVAEATHGETKREVLGSGNARAANQRFPLRSVPVTHVPAATAKGAASTVNLRVDKILWTEVDQFTGAGRPDLRARHRRGRRDLCGFRRWQGRRAAHDRRRKRHRRLSIRHRARRKCRCGKPINAARPATRAERRGKSAACQRWRGSRRCRRHPAQRAAATGRARPTRFRERLRRFCPRLRGDWQGGIAAASRRWRSIRPRHGGWPRGRAIGSGLGVTDRSHRVTCGSWRPIVAGPRAAARVAGAVAGGECPY